jgi:hypothetical protein
MTMAPLDELFPDLARSESRSITVMDYDCLPPGLWASAEHWQYR